MNKKSANLLPSFWPLHRRLFFFGDYLEELLNQGWNIEMAGLIAGNAYNRNKTSVC